MKHTKLAVYTLCIILIISTELLLAWPAESTVNGVVARLQALIVIIPITSALLFIAGVLLTRRLFSKKMAHFTVFIRWGLFLVIFLGVGTYWIFGIMQIPALVGYWILLNALIAP